MIKHLLAVLTLALACVLAPEKAVAQLFTTSPEIVQAGTKNLKIYFHAARSGKQNIVEGACAAATSRETEITLTNVAKASLKELLEDYRDYLRFHNLELWGKNDHRTLAVRRFARRHDDPKLYTAKCRERSPETVCNIAITLLHQLDYMLYCVIERAKRRFLEEGGIREEMSRARRRKRGF